MSENRNEVLSRRRNPRTGNQLLQQRLLQQAEDAVTQAAATSAIVDSGCLWWFTWMQFVTVYFYGLPLFGDLFDSPFSIRYYLPPDGWGCTLPELFLATSIALSVLALARCEMMSRGARGRIRMMLLVLLFSSIAVGFSWSVLSWRNIHLARLENYQKQMREHPERFAWRWWGPESQREQMEIVEEALIAYHKYWDHQTRPGPAAAMFTVPDGFALIPAGSFQMGEARDAVWDAPVREVRVRAFYIAKYEVTKALWDEVRNWGMNHGYTDLSGGFGKAADHPVSDLSWRDAVKWCNARSEKEGLRPCYTADGAVMRTGTAEPVGNWAANGHRLPTEAEWEMAARGGLQGKRFPWGDTISHMEANFCNDGNETGDMECYQTGPSGYHPIFEAGGEPFTAPVGSFPPNGYGLCDMVGNVREWCWEEETIDGMGHLRTIRGGDWASPAGFCLIAVSGLSGPDHPVYFGFRVVRSAFPDE